MNTKRVLLIVIVMTSVSTMACASMSDAVQKAMYPPTPTPPPQWSTEINNLEKLSSFWINDDGDLRRTSIGAMTSLTHGSHVPAHCILVREKFGSGYNLNCTKNDLDVWTVSVEPDSGLLLGVNSHTLLVDN